MSAAGSPLKSNKSRCIPTRRVQINDASQLPNDYSSTPGGTIFSTTPGGTKLIYDRSFLMQCRNSPLAKSPPANMAQIPGVTCPGDVESVKSKPKENGQEQGDVIKEKPAAGAAGDEPSQFQMDI